MQGASINWAKLVMIHIAFLVMDLIVSANIHTSGPDTKMTETWIIQDSTFWKKSGDRDNAGPSRARARARAPAPAWASLQSIANNVNRLTVTVDDMGQYMERMDWTLQRQHHDMTAFFRGINYEPKDQMASRMFNAGVNEGQSTTRPPLFDGTNYSYWKERMRIFIQSNDYKLWLIVKNGCGVPMKKVGEVNVPKTEEEFTDEDCKKMELNAKAINMIYCGVNADDYRKISRCETAKQMWEKLEVTYEGTAQVREAKIDHLTHEYELFSMKENEKIEEMFERFSNIINPLNLLGKTYTDRELVRKVVEERNKRSIALPATTSTHNNVDDEDDDSDDTDLGLFVRKFKKMMLKKGAKKNTPPKCYGRFGKNVQKGFQRKQ
ncbi:unnamed protein product [Cuscuta campestris]|uniref:DUF4219 domain-containing protein n=1 Tax=Cuscuta campestris TaxID=132261 RepID=A0A484L0L7_9ASTE|nr:unnamed protein product [Cuscuta campestris]